MGKYKNPFLFLFTLSMLASCQGDFVRQGDFEPSLGGAVKILEGKFAVLDLFHVDSVPSSSDQIIELSNNLGNDEIDFSALIPSDSLYSSSLSILGNDKNFLIADHGFLSASVNQLQFIQAFSPNDYNYFNTNNGNNISWNGFNSINNYYFPPTTSTQIFDDVHIDSGFYEVALVNNFDFDITVGVSLKSNPSVLFSQVVTIAKNDSTTISFQVTDKDANAIYSWTIFQASSSGISASNTVLINNSNAFEVRVRRSNTYLSSGKFRPLSNIFSTISVELPIPLKSSKKINYLEAADIDLNNFFLGSGLNSTNFELHRTVTDASGIIYTDLIYVISNPNPINWLVGLSYQSIQPTKGLVTVDYILKSAPNAIIDLEPNKSMSIDYGFAESPDILGLGLNEDWQYSYTSTTAPYKDWPVELILKFVPQQSLISKTFNGKGWGNVVVNSQYQNHMGTFVTDSALINLGASHLDSAVSSVKDWTITGFDVNVFNALTPDSLNVVTNYTFKAPWGFKINSNPTISSSSTTMLSSNNGEAYLSSEKLLNLSSNQKIDSLIKACDSVAIYASVRSKSSSPVVNTVSLSAGFDTILSLSNIYLSPNDSAESEWKLVNDITALTDNLRMNYNVDFAASNIQLSSHDSLFLALYLNLYGLP
jgi:hypothetical protein